MDLQFIKSLHCPYTGSAFEVRRVTAEDARGIEYGVLQTEAGRFPIVAGILRLRLDELRQPLVELVEEQQQEKALRAAMEVPFHGRQAAAINLLSRTGYRIGAGRVADLANVYKRRLYRPLQDGNASFSQVLRIARSEKGVAGQLYRFSMPTFLPVYPLVHLIRPGSYVLDFGSGTGHGSFLISRMCPGAAITCADYSFSVLYLAKRYFLSGGQFVCLDGDYPLPFAKSSFSCIFSSDALHLIDSKFALVQEFRRCLDSAGTVILPHLHNGLFPLKFAKSLTPAGYAGLFRDTACQIHSEEVLVRNYLCKGELDLSQAPQIAELDSSVQGVSLVASNDPRVFRKHGDLWERHISRMEHPTLNPVYEVVPGGGLSLRKKMNGHFGGEALQCDGTAYLPDSENLQEIGTVDTRSLIALKQNNRAKFAELARRLIVIETPDSFL